MKLSILSLLSSFTILISLLLYPAPVSAETKCIICSDFETGVEGWTSMGGGSLSIDYNNSCSGKNSLAVTDRSIFWHGPSLNISSYVMPEKEYISTGWIYNQSDSTQTILMSAKLVNSNGTTTFNNIASADVSPLQWTKIEGKIIIPADTVSSVVYFESKNENLDFNLDNYTLTGESVENYTEVTENEKKDEFSFDFEDSFDKWIARGEIRIIRTDEYSSSGKYSLYSTDRNSVWNGPIVDIDTIKRATNYTYSAHLMYNGAEYDKSHTFLLQLQYDIEGKTKYEIISSKKIQKDSWSKISGSYTLPENAKNVFLYVQTENTDSPTSDDLMSFYIDDVEIVDSTIIQIKTRINTALIISLSLLGLLVTFLIIHIIIKKRNKTKKALQLAETDIMTKALNRNTYEAKISTLESNEKSCTELYIAACDVNFLKYINDTFGHEKGDEAIIRCAKALITAADGRGLVYRIGGDEFICLSDISLQQNINDALKKEAETDNGYPFSVAVGFAQLEKDKDLNIKDVIARADQEMYNNKQKIKAEHEDFSRK